MHKPAPEVKVGVSANDNSSVYDRTADAALASVVDSELRRSVGGLFERAQKLVADGEIDLVILAARRLVCLYVLFVRFGMPEIDGCPVVSDRLVEGFPSVVQPGMRVLVLDDTIVVGTTLARLNDDLKAKTGPGGRVLCRVACIDDEQSADYLFEGIDIECLQKRGSQAVQQFSTDVVLAFSKNQLPFFTDFPSTEPLTFTRGAWDEFLGSPRWHVADVTGPMFDGSDIQAFAHIPTQDATSSFLSRLLPEVSELVDNVKLRSYVRSTAEGNIAVFVPLAMIAPCRPAKLDRALEAIGSVLRGSDGRFGMNWELSTPVAKHRLVQLYLSACLLADVWNDLSPIVGIDNGRLAPDHVDRLPIDLYFGPKSNLIFEIFVAAIANFNETKQGQYDLPLRDRLDQPTPSPLLDEPGLLEVFWDCQELLDATGIPEEPGPGELTKIGLIFSHAVSSIFGLLNREYEVPQRKRIRELTSRAEYNKYFSDGELRILNQGFTMRELTASLIPNALTGSSWSRSAMSLGIDVGNDLGIIVPVTRYDSDRDVVYRCYRLGETAQLAEWPLTVAFVSGVVDRFMKAGVGNTDFPIFDRKISISSPESSSSTARSIALFLEGIRNVVPQDTPNEANEYFASLFSEWLIDARTTELREKVLDTIPGAVVERYIGTVNEVGEDSFLATISDLTDESQGVAQINKSRIGTLDHAWLRRGASFTMTSFEREFDSGGKDRTTRVRLRPPNMLDLAQLYRESEADEAVADS
jgi:hypothetical protein